MAPWIAALELFLTQQLLKSHTFHRAVGKVHKNVHRLRHGIPPEEMGGTKIDSPGMQGFIGHFLDELKGQAGRPSTRRPDTSITSQTRPQPESRPQTNYRAPPTSEASRARTNSANTGNQQSSNQSQNQGFLSNFVDEIKGQFRGGGDKPR